MSSYIKVAVVGVGNCCSSFIQGLYYYHDQARTGMLSRRVRSYGVKDIIPVAAFDVDERKVGKDLSQAIFEKPNNTVSFQQVPHMDVKVLKGPTLDGISDHMLNEPADISFREDKSDPVDVTSVLMDKKVDVLVNLLPTGSQKATEFYARCALDAKCAFVNCIPVFIGSDPGWVSKFQEHGLPVLGDDIKSQLGATWLHRCVVGAFLDRGIRILNTAQENYGGNTDFLNMTDPDRIKYKLVSKRSSIEHLVDDHNKGGYSIPPVYAGPGSESSNHGFVKDQKDNKTARIVVDGLGFGDQPINVEINLSVIDSPNSAGIITDAVRCAKVAIDEGIAGVVKEPSAFLFKCPLVKVDDHKSSEDYEKWIA